LKENYSEEQLLPLRSYFIILFDGVICLRRKKLNLSTIEISMLSTSWWRLKNWIIHWLAAVSSPYCSYVLHFPLQSFPPETNGPIYCLYDCYFICLHLSAKLLNSCSLKNTRGYNYLKLYFKQLKHVTDPRIEQELLGEILFKIYS
jgi:hypothetical protein